MDDIRVLRRTLWYRSVMWGSRMSVLGIPLMVLGFVSPTFVIIGMLLLAVPGMWFGAVRWYVTVEYDISYGQFIDRLIDDTTNLRYW
ncbi:hypothetical protein AB0M47_02885 [Hamadaea sp. NPDC051192]|uniref:hypothetical protein n=1 Tax=Hamadaea sp. NPDC051192 TaxID=3154940 RepID=UPI0034233C2F